MVNKRQQSDTDPAVDVVVELEGAEARGLASEVGVRTRHRRPDKAKYDIEVIEGDDWTADKGRFSWKIRIADKPNDWYLEIVIDKDTGEVLHFCSEPFSDHAGHGSAKPGKDRD